MYVTPAQMLIWYDSNRVLQLVRDDGIDASAADLVNSSSDAYQLLVQLELGVESEIDAALQVGQRYSRTDLEALISNAEANPDDRAAQKRASILIRLAADLLYAALVTRRAFGATQIAELCPRYEIAQQTLAELGDGALIFDLDAPKSAGIPVRVKLGSGIDNSIRNSRLFGVFSPNSDGGLFYGS